MKNIKKACIVYNDVDDKYEIWINTDGDWDFSQAFKCIDAKGTGSTDFVHYKAMSSIMDLLKMGYRMVPYKGSDIDYSKMSQ